jgi:hypothetical protein
LVLNATKVAITPITPAIEKTSAMPRSGPPSVPVADRVCAGARRHQGDEHKPHQRRVTANHTVKLVMLATRLLASNGRPDLIINDGQIACRR